MHACMHACINQWWIFGTQRGVQCNFNFVFIENTIYSTTPAMTKTDRVARQCVLAIGALTQLVTPWVQDMP